MTNSSLIPSLIGATRRRAIAQLLLDQAGWGAAAGLAAFALLLLLGTQVLDWYWPVLLLVLTVAVLWWRSRNRVPAPYLVAQQVDASLGLSDLVSTAWHYAQPEPAGKADANFLAILNRRAESAAAAADPRSAIPLLWPRSAWAASAALALAVILFTVRYGVLRSFDLRAPLASISFDTLTGAPKPSAKSTQKLAKQLPDPFGLSVDETEKTGVDEKEIAVQESLRSVDVNDPNKVGRPGEGQTKAGEDQSDSDESSDDGDQASPGKQKPPSGGDPRKAGDQAPGKQGPQPKDNSLMNKMRDALANLMDKLNMDDKGGESKEASSKGSQKAGQKGEKGPPQQGKQDKQGDPNDAQSGDQKAEGDSTQQARSNQPSAGQDPPSQNEKSGIGKQDGNKDTELAEQKEAMGKLSEILGKRALNVQAEVMVEVTNSKNQQLKTPYVNRTGNHIEAGGDLTRDEVPLHLQDYVQRYYEQVRKPAAPAAPKQ